MRDVATMLDELVPMPPRAAGDWARVLRDAGEEKRHSRRVWYAAGGTLAVAAALLTALLVWPFVGADVSVTERALAAVGERPVLHIVLRDPTSRKLIDLETGESRLADAESEIWFDPKRGFHQVSRFEGVVQSDYVSRTKDVDNETSAVYLEFASGYRAALASGDARVVAEEAIEGEAVFWIRIEATVSRYENDPITGERSEHATEVAVSRDTYRPLYLRRTVNGKPFGRRTGAKVLAFETLPAGAGDFSAPPDDGTFAFMGGNGPPIALGAAEGILARTPVWAGRSINGLPLVQVRKKIYSTSPTSPSEGSSHRWTRHEGVTLYYGTLKDGEDPTLDGRKRHVVLDLWRPKDIRAAWEFAAGDYLPPQGTVLAARGRGLLLFNGLVVTIDAGNEEQMLAAARALRVYP